MMSMIIRVPRMGTECEVPLGQLDSVDREELEMLLTDLPSDEPVEIHITRAVLKEYL